MSTNIQGKRMGPPVERKILEVEEELHQGEEDKEEEFVMRDNQYDDASSLASNLRNHLKKYNEEKSNKCNQCNYASSRAGDLRTHLKTHSGEKSNQCNQCDYACSDPSALRSHLALFCPIMSHIY